MTVLENQEKITEHTDSAEFRVKANESFANEVLRNFRLIRNDRRTHERNSSNKEPFVWRDAIGQRIEPDDWGVWLEGSGQVDCNLVRILRFTDQKLVVQTNDMTIAKNWYGPIKRIDQCRFIKISREVLPSLYK